MNPDRRRQYQRAGFSAEAPVSWPYPQYTIIGLDILCTPSKIVKGPGRYIDKHITNKCSPFACALYGVLDAAFPLKHSPAGEAVLRQLREDALEVNLTIAYATETPWTIFPVLIAAID